MFPRTAALPKWAGCEEEIDDQSDAVEKKANNGSATTPTRRYRLSKPRAHRSPSPSLA